MPALHVSEQMNGGVLPQPRPIKTAFADKPRAGAKRDTVDGRKPRKAGVHLDRGETSGSSPTSAGVTVAPGKPGRSDRSRKVPLAVPVLGRDKQPLMPTSAARARKLLARGRAVIVLVRPFVIRMKDITSTDGTAEVQEMAMGVDPGSKHTGVAVFRTSGPGGRDRHGVLGIRIEHRAGAIHRHMLVRAGRRHNRRSRKRHRKPRFRNRLRPAGWLAPSLLHRVEGVHSVVKWLASLFPVTAIYQEVARFDTQKMVDPEIHGVEYQQGTLAGFEVREYLLAKFGRKCVYCGAEGVPLNQDHVIPRASAGSDRLTNLVLSCIPCNEAKGNRPVKEFVTDPVRLARVEAWVRKPLRDAAAMNSTRKAIQARLQETGLPVYAGTGGQTRYNRFRNELSKSHTNDALAVGNAETITSSISSVLVAEHKGRGSYARTRSNVAGFPRLYLTRQKEHFGFITGDLVRAVVPAGKYAGTHVGRVSIRAKGTFAILTQEGLVPSVPHRYCTRIQRGAGWHYTIEVEGYEVK